MIKNISNYKLLTPKQNHFIDRKIEKLGKLRCAMENAGRAVYSEVLKHYKSCKTTVLCGPGNNGGDGYVAARLLAKEGWPVRVLTYGSPKLGSLAHSMKLEWTGALGTLSDSEIQKDELIIDALFGSGLNRELPNNLKFLLGNLKRVISIDVPSGVNGLTGEIKNFALQAELTITFTTAKPGHYLYPGKAHIGQLKIKDIGIDFDLINKIKVKFYLNHPSLWNLTGQTFDDYKYKRGIVSIVGSKYTTGAARLSALAAKNSGAGLVTLFPFGQYALYANFSPCFMIDHNNFDEVLNDNRRNTWVCGPGLSSFEFLESFPKLFSFGKNIVADAGAFERNNSDILKGVSVITPHKGEFERVFGKLGADKVADVRKAATKIQSVIVLKGPDTLIVSPEGKIVINHHASPRLATAGSGDLLSGIIATLIASGMNFWESACAGVWIHGEAANLCDHNWPDAEMIAQQLGKARDNAYKLYQNEKK